MSLQSSQDTSNLLLVKQKGSKYKYGDSKLRENRKIYMQPRMTRDNDEKYTRNSTEDRLIAALDRKRAIERFMEWQEKLESKKTDVMGFFQALAPEVATDLVMMAFDPNVSEKVRLTAQQDILDRAGYGKVNKHAVAAVDETMPREAIYSIIESVSDIIEIEDDEPEDSY